MDVLQLRRLVFEVALEIEDPAQLLEALDRVVRVFDHVTECLLSLGRGIVVRVPLVLKPLLVLAFVVLLTVGLAQPDRIGVVQLPLFLE